MRTPVQDQVGSLFQGEENNAELSIVVDDDAAIGASPEGASGEGIDGE